MILKKITAAFLLLSMFVLSSCGNNSEISDEAQPQTEYAQPVYTEKAGNIIKTETVYVNLDSSGNIQKINVSDWIHTDRSGVYVDDVSSLENIVNIKSEIQPDLTADTLRWHMETTDLYYSGTTDKTPPVTFSVEYFLNGSKIQPEQLAGQSGEVKINIKITNGAVKKVAVDGREYTVSLPVIAVGGMILPEAVFSDVDIKNAQSFSDGTKQLVAFVSMPGFDESLGFSENEIGGFADMITADEITVTAHAENFSLENIYFAVLPVASLNFDMAMPEAVNDVKSAVSALKSFQNALNELDPDKIIYSLLTDEAKVSSLLGAVNDASELYENNRNLLELAGKYSTPENAETVRILIETLNSPEVKEMMSVIADPEVQDFITGLPIIMETFGDVTPLLEEIQKDLARPEVQSELSNLPETVKKLTDIAKVISENEKEIDAVLSALDGSGGQSLETLLEGINPDDFDFSDDKYGDIAENSDLLVALAEEWLKFGSEYRLFTDAAEEMSVSLMFIYKTPVIKHTVS